MGSLAITDTDSKTNYSNLPVTLADNANAITGAGSDGSQIGGAYNVNGGLNASQNLSVARGGSLSLNTTTLDAGAINRAFDFGSNLVGIMADLTRQNNNAAQVQTGQALQAAAVGVTEQKVEQTGILKTVENNKTLIYAAVAAAVAYLYLRKK